MIIGVVFSNLIKMASSSFRSLLEDFVRNTVSNFVEEEFDILVYKFDKGVLLKADVEYDALNRIRNIRSVYVRNDGTIEYKTPVRFLKPSINIAQVNSNEHLRSIILGTRSF
ncbi:hypothetical protein K439DRAFT_813559 [Ramaria rubella]|nr:hypothetical protein K439DRAFT_813559 [Ramaria rubella]